MNELIERIFAGFAVGEKAIPVKFLHYEGHGEPYVTYQQVDTDSSIFGDDELVGYVEYYDFDVYSKGNYFRIVEAVRALLEANGFTWQVSRSGGDIWEPDTGFHHKNLCFAIHREE